VHFVALRYMIVITVQVQKNIKTETRRHIDSSEKEMFVLDGSTLNNVDNF